MIAKPLWSMPCTIRSASSFGLPEKPRATNVAPLAIASCSGLIGPVRRALGRRLGHEADHGGRRRLALGQPVDRVVHDDVADVEVAPRGVDEVPAADGERVAVTAQRQHLQVRVGDLDARGDRHGPAVDGVEAVGADEERQPARAADAADQHDVLRARSPWRAASCRRRSGRRSRRSPGTRSASRRSCSPRACVRRDCHADQA